MLIHVAVPVPSLGLLTYRVPDEPAAPAGGARVVVPLGIANRHGHRDGRCAGVDARRRAESSRSRQVLDDRTRSCRPRSSSWRAGRPTTTPPGRATRSRRCCRRRREAAAPTRTRRCASRHRRRRTCAREPRSVSQAGDAERQAARGAELLAGAPGGLATPSSRARGIAADVVARLSARGLVSVRQDRVDRDPFDTAVASTSRAVRSRPAPDARSRQRRSTRLRALAESRRFHVALLHGVTGSGKTEVYLRLCGAPFATSGRSVLMLVPEIALTPAMVGAVPPTRSASASPIQHSGLSDGERHDQWQRIRRGDVDVVVGTRSAVFAPLERLGLIIVDEEHDASYKQEESPRYHGRDVAIVRGQRARRARGARLGDAVDGELLQRRCIGRYERVVLERRVLDRPLAAVTVVDMREEYAARRPGRRPEPRARRGDRRCGSSGSEQALVLLNRRGFATAVFCRQCAGTMRLSRTAACRWSCTARAASRRARCHYCNYSMRVPTACRKCAGAVSRADRASAPSASRPRCGGSFRARVWRGSIATRSAARAR